MRHLKQAFLFVLQKDLSNRFTKFSAYYKMTIEHVKKCNDVSYTYNYEISMEWNGIKFPFG